MQAWNLLGLCRTSMGDIRDGVKSYERAVELKPDLKEGWINMGQALKEEGRTKEADRAFTKALSLDDKGSPSLAAYRILAQMRQGLGNHAAAVKILDKAIGFSKPEMVGRVLGCRVLVHAALVSISTLDARRRIAYSSNVSSGSTCFGIWVIIVMYGDGVTVMILVPVLLRHVLLHAASMPTPFWHVHAIHFT